MKGQNIILLDNLLEYFESVSKILIKKRGYYFYFNKPNRKSKTVLIHIHHCGECCYGNGKIGKSKPGKNGVWIGPFISKESLTEFVNDNFPDLNGLLSDCNCIK